MAIVAYGLGVDEMLEEYIRLVSNVDLYTLFPISTVYEKLCSIIHFTTGKQPPHQFHFY